MAARISRVRIIKRRFSHSAPLDQAQNGMYYARLTDFDRLTITGIQNKVLFRARGVVAAKWEPQADETILLVMREAPEDEPVAVQAFRPRIGGDWETEDAHATVHLSPNGKHVALVFSFPNAAIAVLPIGHVMKEFDARANLGVAPTSVEWLDDGAKLQVMTGDQTLVWTANKRVFAKA